MQTKGAINFNNRSDEQSSLSGKTNVSDQKMIDKLLKDVFAVDETENDSIPKEEEQKVQDAQEEGHKDLLKETAKEQEKNIKKLDDLTQIADLVLFRLRTANPFDPFPDEITIDTSKISVIHRTFFESGRIHSVMIKNVSDVFVDTGLLFARICIINSGYTENEVVVNYLGKDDATKARRIIQGLVVAQAEKIDFAKLQEELSDEEIVEKIEKLGKARL